MGGMTVAKINATGTSMIAKADSEAKSLELKAVEAQAVAEMARMAVDAVETDQAGRLAAAKASAEKAVSAARERHQEDFHTLKRAEDLAAADKV